MTHYVIELALWIFVVYIIGCIIGYLLRRMFGSHTVQDRAAAPVISTAPSMAPVESQAAAPATLAEPAASGDAIQDAVTAIPRMERPRGLAEPREGQADDLQRISGIGPKNEKILHNLGVFHFDQIAAWTAEQVEWVDDHLKFNGRISREHWISQAKLLADGMEEEFTRLYGSGGKKNDDGLAVSGEKTRRT
ncbi:MAG: hypothetical protein KDK89_21235 [Alphaproteobacteria bacterium]|nr:hypothetical protein [Alphaproteobacteria bacterium]